MNMLERTLAATSAALLAVPVAAETWTPAWMASPEAVWTTEFDFPTGLPESIAGATIRQPVTLNWSGDRLRLVLSNAYGAGPLEVTATSLAPAGEGARLSAPARSVTFGGAGSIVIAPGARVVSDPVEMSVTAGDRISATLSFGPDAVAEDFHWDARVTSYVIEGDVAAQNPEITGRTTARVALSGVLTDRKASTVVVAMGDSITDGNGAPIDADARWPDFLARRLASEGVAVVNAGISGGRLLTDGMGSSVLARLDRDLLAMPGADTVVLLIGTNDIAWPGSPFAPEEPAMTLDELKAGFRQVAARTRLHGIRLIVGTVPPFRGALPGTPMEASYWSEEKEALRQALNAWLRQARFHDGLVDFDAVLRDPDNPDRLLPHHDSGDRLHPGPAGNKAMAAALDLELLQGADK